MEGVFIPPEKSDQMPNSWECPLPTTILEENTLPVTRVFGPEQLTLRRVFGPQQLTTRNMSTTDVVTTDVHVNVHVDVPTVEDVTVVKENQVDDTLGGSYKRPRRAAAIEATKTIKKVLKWERCKESSTMFKTAAFEINEEFDRVSNPVRATKKQVSKPTVSGLLHIAAGGHVSTSSAVPSDNMSHMGDVENVVSDDECNALKSDEEDNDEDMNDSDDDVGSLASFVVDDDYISDEDETVEDSERPCKKTKYESQSDAESDDDESCSDEDDESVQFDDESDADASVGSESDIGSDVVDSELGETGDKNGVDDQTHDAKEDGHVEVMDHCHGEGYMDELQDPDVTKVDLMDIDGISEVPVNVLDVLDVLEPVYATEVVEAVDTGYSEEVFGYLSQDAPSPTNIEHFLSGG